MKEKQMGQRICRADNKCSIVTIAFTPGKNPPPPICNRKRYNKWYYNFLSQGNECYISYSLDGLFIKVLVIVKP